MSAGDETSASGLLDRRLFLRRGLRWSAAIAAAPSIAFAADLPSDPTRTPGQPFSNYGQPSPQEKATIRWISANRAVAGNGVSWTPLHDLEGIITPSGLHFERHHNGVPQIDGEAHRLSVHGLVKQPLSFTIDALKRYPQCSRIGFVECGGNSNSSWNLEPLQTRAGYLHGLASNSEWTGVPLAIVLDEAGVDPAARWLVLEASDAIGMNISLPLAKARKDCLLALYQNGERLRPEQGYPLRLIVPGWEGVLNVKWLSRIELTTEPVMSRNETSRYTELQPDGRARQFTFVMDVKSLITSPSPGHLLSEKGLYEIRGLAWSGRGKVKKVEVSADAGKTWKPAALQGPVLPMSFTRFRIPWRWDGAAATLQSRAVDETGAVQPTRTALVAQRGRAGYFHYNAIVSWQVSEDGELSHVYA
ncbi:sulfite dehydrogenase [Nevskia ramosa]|uniref:sulfite dehydrogenase n=1 Tax=Nevskia ramosa TaxID=64002 RepID=UPI0003B544A4|nr:sulfite dehydrogenase [Nevskia ramosa]